MPNLPSQPCIVLVIAIALTGCDARLDHFETNNLQALVLQESRGVDPSNVAMDASIVTERLFGTPGQPRVLDQFSESGLLDPEQLARAAGAVSSEKDGRHLGLYREHCVVCHGLAGSGTGPASQLQNPYPRDFRHGVFKWKSTDRSARPTRDDLHELIVRGVPGTAMPSFRLLDEEDIKGLVDYVIFLSIRGEFERRLMAAAVDQLGYGEESPDSLIDSEQGRAVADSVLATVTQSWEAAPNQVTWAPEMPTLDSQQRDKSIARGKDIFHGQIANCVGCHGPSGNGAAVTLDFDDWTKEFSTKLGLTPTDRVAMRPFRDAGALRPRQIKPRSLNEGAFHGGGDPQTLFRRVSQGIAGTPMPKVDVVEEPNGKGLTESQVWDLVRYVKSIGIRDEQESRGEAVK